MIKNIKKWLKNIKHQMILMLFVLSVVGMFQNNWRNTFSQLLISIAAALLTDYIATYIKKKKHFFSESAVITGFIIALVLPPGVKWFIPLTAAIIAIAQKYIIRYDNKRIFNPASLGLLVSFFAFKTFMFWWGGSVWWLVLLMGIPIMYFFKRLELPLSYLGAFIITLGISNFINKAPVMNAFLMANSFFAFVMVVEPKTSPNSMVGRILFGFLLGVLSGMLIIFLPQYDAFLISLLVLNVLVPVINKKIRIF